MAYEPASELTLRSIRTVHRIALKHEKFRAEAKAALTDLNRVKGRADREDGKLADLCYGELAALDTEDSVPEQPSGGA